MKKIIIILLLITFSLIGKSENYIGKTTSYILDEVINTFVYSKTKDTSDITFISFHIQSQSFLLNKHFNYSFEDGGITFSGDWVYCYDSKDGITKSGLSLNVSDDEIVIHNSKNKSVSTYYFLNDECTSFRILYYNSSEFEMKYILKTKYKKKTNGIDDKAWDLVNPDGGVFEYCLNTDILKDQYIFTVEVCWLSL